MPKGRGQANTLSTQTNKAAFARELMAGNYNKVLRLLRAGADVNQNVINGDAPLSIACYEGHVDCARLLIENEADVDKARIEDGATPLLIACYEGHVDCARQLIENNADVDRATTDNGVTPLYIACDKGHADCTRLLIENKADVGRRQDKRRRRDSALHSV